LKAEFLWVLTRQQDISGAASAPRQAVEDIIAEQIPNYDYKNNLSKTVQGNKCSYLTAIQAFLQ
jgi:hypothetical protein